MALTDAVAVDDGQSDAGTVMVTAGAGQIVTVADPLDVPLQCASETDVTL